MNLSSSSNSTVDALTVTQAMSLAKGALENVTVTVLGEVSEVSDRAGYKAVYFTLKDETAAMPSLMWHDVYRSSGVELRAGMLVEARGTFGVYLPKGRMNFTVRSLNLAGEGALRIRVARLAKALEKEGLMAVERKLPLPKYPDKIALVTSPRGKAVHDCIRTLRRRYPLAEVLLYGVAVEGANAVEEITHGIREAIEGDAEIILLVRGGGSYEDLLPFNDESIARLIASSPKPIVTGIGHEPDNSIADMVASLRCSTPTAAAEAVVPDIENVSSLLHSAASRIAHSMQTNLASVRHRYEAALTRPVFTDPNAVLSSQYLSVDQAAHRLSRAIPDTLKRDETQIALLDNRIQRLKSTLFIRHRQMIALFASRIEDLSPLSILSRGYAAVYDSDNHIIDSVCKVAIGDYLAIHLKDGNIGCIVDNKGGESGE